MQSTILTSEQFKVLAKTLKSVYLQKDFLATEETCKIWYQMLKHHDYKSLTLAVQEYILTKPFPPTIADLNALASEINVKPLPDWSGGWDEVQMAIRTYGHNNYQQAIEGMNPITRECVKRIGWRQLCYDENQIAHRANFKVIYEGLCERRKKDSMLSGSLLQAIENKRLEAK